MAMTVAMTVATAAEDKDRGRALASPSLCRFEAYISTNNPKIMRPISHDSPGLALIAYAFLAAAVAAPLATASIAPPRYTWSVVVDGQSTSASSALGVAGFTPILETNAAYTLTVSIITTADGTTCLPCARDLHAVGGYPVVVLANSQLVATQNWRNMTIVRSGYKPALAAWQLKVTTVSAPGVALLYVKPSAFLPYLLAKEQFNTAKSFAFSVTTLLSLASGSPTSPLGSLSALGAPTTAVSPLLATVGRTLGLLSGSLLISPNDWKTSAVVTPTFPSSITSAAAVCGSASAVTIIDADEVNGTSIFATSKGVVVKLNGKEMALTLAQCVSNVVVTCSRDPVLAQCVASIVVGTQTAWSINLTTGSAQELVDSNGATLAQYLGTTAFTIVDANFSNEHCGTIAFLVLRSSGVYAIMTLEESSWNVKFQFPTTVPFYSPNSATPQLFNASSVIQYPMSITVTTTGSRPLTLNKILYSQMPTEELFIYGSALLFSPDGGNSMFLMDTLQAPLTVTSLESSYASYGYLYLTSDGTMNAGISSFPQSFPIGRAPSNTVALKFDSTEQPYALTWTAAGLARSNINWQAEWAPAILNAATASGAWTGITATCPYSSLYASGPLTPQYTRSATPVAANTATGAGPSTPRVNVQLPPAIYLDYKQSYVFTVDLSPPAGADLASIVMAFSISNPDLIGVLAVRLEIPAQNRVVYTVTVSDLGQYPAQVKPGADPSAAALTIEILKGESCAAAALGPLIVYVGCPPGLLLQVDPIPVSSMTCIDPVAEVPCLYMDADYKPTFSLWDQVTGTATPFQSPVTLTLIAGASATVKAPGLSTGSFAASQIAAINQYSWSPNMNVDLVQLADGRYVFPSGQGVNISWVCLTGSPCAGVTPPFPHPAEYYFSVHVSTIGVATGHSYCLLQSTYPVRLYGLSVDLATSLLATGISLAITVALVLMIAVYQRRKQVRANLMVAPVAEYPIGSGPHATIGRPFGSAGGAAHGGSTRPTSAQSGGSTAPLVGASGGGGDADGGSSSAVAPSTAPTTMPALRPILRARPAIPEDAEDQAMQ